MASNVVIGFEAVEFRIIFGGHVEIQFIVFCNLGGALVITP